jgi:hypothetical protein
MMLTDRDLIDQLVDKRRFQALAARHDLPVPPALHLRPRRPPPAEATPRRQTRASHARVPTLTPRPDKAPAAQDDRP